MAQNKELKEQSTLNSITFHYIKSEGFKTFIATGAIGGVTVNSLINMNLYTDRIVIPTEITQEVEPDGKLGKEIDVNRKKGVIRDVQSSVLMDATTAKNLVNWLNKQIKIIETASKTK